MNNKIIKKIKNKLFKNGEVIKMLHNSDLSDRLTFNGIVREASTYAIDIIATKMINDFEFAKTITETTHLEYTEKALNEIVKELK